LTSNNAITGTWSPSVISTATVGTQTYTFTPTTLGCYANATMNVTINLLPNAGTNGVLNICTNASSQDLFSSLLGTPQTGGAWSPALASGTGIFNPSLDAAGVYTYTVTGIAPCGSDSATVTVTKTQAPNPGTNATLKLCINSSSSDLFTSLGGVPQTGGTWSPALASGTGIFNPSVDAAGLYTYTLSGTAPCTAVSATVNVIVNPLPNAGTNGVLNICSNASPQNLFSSLLGTPQTGGTWSPALASGTGVFNPSVDTAGVYTYTVTGIAPCGSDSATVTVTKTQAPNPGVSGLLNICSNSSSQDLFISLGGTPQTGGVWSPALASGTGLFNPSLDAASVYTYTLTGTAPCSNLSSTITVSISQEPNAGTDGSLTICSNGKPKNLFSFLGGTPQTGGTWSPALASGTGMFNPAVDLAGTYTYTVNNSSACIPAQATVNVTVDTTCPEIVIIAPDGFSPNGDTVNDEFVIQNLADLYPNFSLKVYNRYGNVLYEGNINTPNWNGKASQGMTVGDGVLPTGVYFYVIEFNDGARKPLQGRVYLSR
jgi:gliding motility-associated-like protein